MKYAKLMLCILACVSSLAADETDLTISLTTDKTHYAVGEPVVISHVVTNPTAETILMWYGCPCCEYELALEDAFGGVIPTEPRITCPQVAGHWEFAPFETRIFEHGLWMQDTEHFPAGESPIESQLTPGTYRLVATWVDRGRVTSDDFVICDDDCSGEPRGFWIPAAGNNTGLYGTRWKTDLELQGLSPDGSGRSFLKVSLFPHGVSSPDPATVEFEFGDFIYHGDRIENVLDELFGFEGHAALHVEIRGSSPHLQSRTYNESEDGTFGQVIPAVPSSEAAPNLILPNLRNEAGKWRSNIGLINPSGEPRTVTVVLFSGQLWDFDVDLGPYEYRQLDDVFVGKTTQDNATAHLYCQTGSILAYGSVIDNRTGDATFVRARPLPARLE